MLYKVKKSFIERNGKIRKKGDVIPMVDVVAKFYEENKFIEKIEDGHVTSIQLIEKKGKKKKK